MGGRGGVSPPSGSRTRRPARSAAPAVPLGKGGGREDTVTPGRDPAPASPRPPPPVWPAPYRWAPGPSRPHPRPPPARSPLGWPAVPARPAPPGRRRSCRQTGIRQGPRTRPPQHLPCGGAACSRGPALASQTGSCSAPGAAGRARPRPPAAPPAAPAASCHPCRSARGPGRTLGRRGGGGRSAQRVPPSPQPHLTARSAPAAATGCPKRSEDPALKE